MTRITHGFGLLLAGAIWAGLADAAAPEPSVKAASKAAAKADPKPDPKADPKPDPKSDPKADPKSDPNAAPTTIEVPVAKPDEVLSKSSFDVSMSLGGNALGKVGTSTDTEFRVGQQLHQVSELEMNVDRGGVRFQIRNQTGFVESADGQLIRFHSVSRTAGAVQQTKTTLGEIAEPTAGGERVVTLRLSDGTRVLSTKLNWPKEALSPRQAQRRLMEGGLAVDKTVELLVYPIPDDPETAKLHKYRVVAEENLPFGTANVKVFRVEVVSELLGQEIKQLHWLDAKGLMYRHEVTLGAMTITLVRTK